MKSQDILKLVKIVLTYVDAKQQCTAQFVENYLIEYGRTGRKTWAIEITTKVDKYFVAYIYPANKESQAAQEKQPWLTDVGWLPRPQDKMSRYDLETEHAEDVQFAITLVLTKMIGIVVHDALVIESEMDAPPVREEPV